MASGKSKFEKLINDIAENLEWEIEWENGMASIDFEAESGNVLTLYITENEGSIQFDVTSEAGFDSEENISHEISTLLLKRNVLLDVGAWAIEQWGEEWYFAVMFVTNAEELEPMPYETIQSKVDLLVEECDEFNTIWAEED